MSKDKTPTLSLRWGKLNTANAADVRKQFADAGFAMVPDGTVGWQIVGHGLPAVDSGLANEPNLVMDHRGQETLITFTQVPK